MGLSTSKILCASGLRRKVRIIANDITVNICGSSCSIDRILFMTALDSENTVRKHNMFSFDSIIRDTFN